MQTYDLTKKGVLYCNPVANQKGGIKVADDIDWFDYDRYGNLWALSAKNSVYRFLPDGECNVFISEEKAHNVDFLLVLRGNTKVQAIALLKGGKLKIFKFAGIEIPNSIDNISEIAAGCTETHKNFSSFAAFARSHDGYILTIKENGDYKVRENRWSSLDEWKRERNVCQ